MLSLLTDNLDLWAEGLRNTVLLTVTGFVIAFFVAIPIALARLSDNRLLSGAAYGYVYVVRGTPLLVQIFLIYYGLGQFNGALRDLGLWWFFRDAFNCGLTAFVINSVAYQAEILRGGILAVPRGVIEGGRAGQHHHRARRHGAGPLPVLADLRPVGLLHRRAQLPACRAHYRGALAPAGSTQ